MTATRVLAVDLIRPDPPCSNAKGVTVPGFSARSRRSARWHSLALLAVVVPVGFALKLYEGPGAWWLNNWGASVAYELFFILLAFLVAARRGAIEPIPVIVCVVTIALEVLQLWQPEWLQAIRATRIGGWVLGNSFSWADMPAYPIGCALGWLVLRWIARRVGRA